MRITTTKMVIMIIIYQTSDAMIYTRGDPEITGLTLLNIYSLQFLHEVCTKRNSDQTDSVGNKRYQSQMYSIVLCVVMETH